jgi:TonB-linked SusC/RagA family outer membrane protein
MNRKIFTVVSGFLLVLYATCGYAQQTVRGTVSDKDGVPLVGVTIVIEGTNRGTTTNIDGNYSIQAKASETITYNYIGFESRQIQVGNQSVIDVTLSEDLEELDEVVVTALGFREQKDNIGYASSKINEEAVQRAKESTLINSLSGKASGVRISRNSGDPGAGALIQIRGASTITGSIQPLIVVDGVPISNDNRGTNQIAQQSRLNDINPDDIEDITILKGASAAALWGTRAAGGAIIITTKTGNYNQKLKVNIKSTYSIDQINRRYPLQTKFGQGNEGMFSPTARDSWGDNIANRAGGADELNTNGEFFVDQNGDVYYPVTGKNSRQTFIDENFDQVFQTGSFFENSVSLSAGNENSTVFFSASNLDQEGVIKNNSDYRRSTLRLNVKHLLANDFEISVNSGYTNTQSNRIRRGAQSSGLYLGLLRTPPDFNNTGYRGSYFSGPDASPIPNRHRSYRRYLGSSSNPVYNNPSWTINEQQDLANVDRYINRVKLTYNPLPWIDIIGRAGLDSYTEEKTQFFTPGSASGAFRTGLFEREIANNSIFNSDLIAKANKDFGDFGGSLLFGFNYNQRTLKVSESEIVNFIQFVDVGSTTRDMDNASPENRDVQSTVGQERTAGFYTEAVLNAYDQLFITGTLRAETASTFGSQSDATFLFPSISAAWQFTDILNSNVLSFGKLRASYGEVGVQPGRYNTVNEVVQPTYADEYGGDLNVGLYGLGGFTFSQSLGNPFLLPERKKEIEVGTDLRFLNDRISLSATYYTNTTEDVLLDFPIANTTGYDETLDNVAEIANRGVEVDLGFNILNTRDLQWTANFIYTRIRNEVTDLQGVESVNLGGLSAVNARAVEGEPLGVLWGSRTERDENGNIVFDEFGFPVQDEEVGVIGDPNPDWQGSFYTTLKYKDFTISALFETFQGADIFAGTKSVLYNLGTWEDSGIETTADVNLLEANGNVIPAGTTFRGVVRDFGAGPVALTEPWYLGDGGFFSGGNDEFYIEDGSWTRLRELQIAYNLNGPVLDNIGLQSAEISFTGRNLILWSPFEGNDPDTNLEGVSKARGIDYFNNPSTRSYVFTLLLKF